MEAGNIVMPTDDFDGLEITNTPPKSITKNSHDVFPSLPIGDHDLTVDRSVYMHQAAGIDFSEYAILVQPDGSTANRSASAYMWDSLTGGVGTAMYSAPEQAVSSRRRHPGSGDPSNSTFGYDSKADMFSLGVILFEMCWKPFSTGMERISVLKDLRELAKLPLDFVDVIPENLCKIITSLVQKDPVMRPSAAELSASSLMPGKINIDKAYLREITESLLNPRSEMLQEVISALFRLRSDDLRLGGALNADHNATKTSERREEWTKEIISLQPISSWCEKLAGNLYKNSNSRLQFDRAIAENPFLYNALPLQLHDALVQSLSKVFLCHGAVRLAPPIFQRTAADIIDSDAMKALEQEESWPYTIKSGSNIHGDKLGVSFLDSAGGIVTLPGNLSFPFCRYAGKLGITSSQRFQIDKVFFGGTGDGDIESKTHAVYDIIIPDTSSLEQVMAPNSTVEVDSSSRLSVQQTRTEAEKISLYTGQTLVRDRGRALAEADVIMASLECSFLMHPLGLNKFSATSGVKQSAITKRVLWIGDLRMCKVLFEVSKIPAEKCPAMLKLLQLQFEEAVYMSEKIKFADTIFSKIKDIGVSEACAKLLFQFVKVLLPKLQKSTDQDVKSVLSVLDELELCFYRHPIVVEMRRILVLDRETVQSTGSDLKNVSNKKPFAPTKVCTVFHFIYPHHFFFFYRPHPLKLVY